MGGGCTNPIEKGAVGKGHGGYCRERAIRFSGKEPRRSVRQQAPVQNQHRKTGGRLRWTGIEGERNRYFCSNHDSESLNPSWLQLMQMKGRCNSRLGDGCDQGLATLRGKGVRHSLVRMAAGVLAIWLS
jgi:hypothetical protein